MKHGEKEGFFYDKVINLSVFNPCFIRGKRNLLWLLVFFVAITLLWLRQWAALRFSLA